MNGQWRGRYSSTNSSGQLIINIDDRGDRYSGTAFLIADGNAQIPVVVAPISTINKNRKISLSISPLLSMNPQTRAFDRWENLRNLFPPNTVWPNRADVKFEWNSKHLSVNWTTDIGTAGSAKLSKTSADLPSTLASLQYDWNGFKEFVATLEKRRFLFRGQTVIARLRTSFHRSGRADLVRFLAEDIPALYRQLSQRTRHIYNLQIPEQNGSFFNLVQHHGYPTPLLDWTYSPYVAAFFAYRSTINSVAEARASRDKKVRVFIFDQKQWHQNYERVQYLNLPGPNFSILEFMAMDNERLIPQQAASSLTNIDDIETYIAEREAQAGKTYLSAIDLPLRERRRAMDELSYMGITAGSLFPGLDGACEELRERSFDL
jgi:FRG domain